MSNLHETSEERAGLARSEEGLNRLSDPDRLLSNWNILKSRHHHLHAPEAARLLDVPEAALVASRIGTGAERLVPNIERLLEPILEWGRVLCAFSNACGVHMPLGVTRGYSEEGLYVLEGEHMHARVDTQSISDAYLFQDRDENHGSSRSLQFFDAAGNTIIKVFLFHKGRFEKAQTHFEASGATNQKRVISPAMPSMGMFDAEAQSLKEDPDELRVEGPVKDIIAGVLRGGGQFQIEMVGDHALAKWTGSFREARMDEAMFHLHEPDLRAHLRLSPLTAAWRTRQGALALNDDEGRLIRIKKEKG